MKRGEVARKIVDLLAEVDGLTVNGASEILISCNQLIKERTYKAMEEEESKPLVEALSHLNRSGIIQ